MENASGDQYKKAETFRQLHQQPGIFVIPNPWDAGSAKILTGLGYAALATTSAGQSYTIGKADNQSTRDESLENARMIVNATHLPVAADLEDGFGESGEACAETIMLAAGVGLVGGSIGDSNNKTDHPMYKLEQAVVRVKAAVEAASRLPFYFTVTARCENYLYGRSDLRDTIRRLVAYAEAGADVLFAPGIKTPEEIRAIVSAVAPKPVNVLWGYPDQLLTVNDMAKLGVKRLSTGSSLVRSAYGSFYEAAKEIRYKGTSNYATNAIAYPEMNALLLKESFKSLK